MLAPPPVPPAEPPARAASSCSRGRRRLQRQISRAFSRDPHAGAQILIPCALPVLLGPRPRTLSRAKAEPREESLWPCAQPRSARSPDSRARPVRPDSRVGPSSAPSTGTITLAGGGIRIRVRLPAARPRNARACVRPRRPGRLAPAPGRRRAKTRTLEKSNKGSGAQRLFTRIAIRHSRYT